jgi:hypothetical protein
VKQPAKWPQEKVWFRAQNAILDIHIGSPHYQKKIHLTARLSAACAQKQTKELRGPKAIHLLKCSKVDPLITPQHVAGEAGRCFRRVWLRYPALDILSDSAHELPFG